MGWFFRSFFLKMNLNRFIQEPITTSRLEESKLFDSSVTDTHYKLVAPRSYHRFGIKFAGCSFYRPQKFTRKLRQILAYSLFRNKKKWHFLKASGRPGKGVRPKKQRQAAGGG
jgi:hypothetical protein